MTPEQFAEVTASDASLVCKDLIDLMTPPDGWVPEKIVMKEEKSDQARKTTYQPDLARTSAALKATFERVQKAP